jgi:hypothetical protein
MFANMGARMDDKKVYIESKAWLKNEYLVIPPGTKQSFAGSAHKKCRCCQEVKFTVEFMDNEQFEDGKLPACDTCIKAKNGREIVNNTGKVSLCKKCQQKNR